MLRVGSGYPPGGHPGSTLGHDSVWVSGWSLRLRISDPDRTTLRLIHEAKKETVSKVIIDRWEGVTPRG